MKTAVYIEDGVTQIVITPETEFEQKVLDMLSGPNIETQIWRGSFYSCQGGWNRMQDHPTKNSLMLRAAAPKSES